MLTVSRRSNSIENDYKTAKVNIRGVDIEVNVIRAAVMASE